VTDLVCYAGIPKFLIIITSRMTTKNWQTATKDISFLSVQLGYRSCALEHYHYGMGIYYGRDDGGEGVSSL
jgi:hypothetical protein